MAKLEILCLTMNVGGQQQPDAAPLHQRHHQYQHARQRDQVQQMVQSGTADGTAIGNKNWGLQSIRGGQNSCTVLDTAAGDRIQVAGIAAGNRYR